MIEAAVARRPTVLASAVRAAAVAVSGALAMLWAIEGVVKVRAGFGASDILLVADGAVRNTRVPEWFAPIGALMRGIPAVFGVGIPMLELLLGAVFAVLAVGGLLALLRVRGVAHRSPRRVTTVAALVSGGTLALYWTSDQLIAQYPVMLVLSLLLLAVETLTPSAVVATTEG
ncbi:MULTISPECIES: hypothetical protein [unclassified Leucobacter]|uniref:hypothetical protein n=1 Tax=unclassified Leucobacter TaxID=2621730 RepID=UPI003017E4CA